MERQGEGTKLDHDFLPYQRRERCSQGLELIAFITQKSHFLSVSFFLSFLHRVSVFPLSLSLLCAIYSFALHLSTSLTLASVFLTCAARHWRISKCAIYIKSRKLSPIPSMYPSLSLSLSFSLSLSVSRTGVCVTVR